MFYVGLDTDSAWLLFNSYWGQTIQGHYYAKIYVGYGNLKILPELVLFPTWEHIQETQGRLTGLIQLLLFTNPYSPVFTYISTKLDMNFIIIIVFF